MTQQEMFKNAKWVKAKNSCCISPCIRGEFEVNKAREATITICGLGFFALYINFERVSDELFVPVNSHYHHYEQCHCFKTHGEQLAFRIYCVKYDISQYIKQGSNEIVVILGPGWYRPYGECKLCYKIELCDKTVISDESLRCCESPISQYSLTKGEVQDYLKYDYKAFSVIPNYNNEAWENVEITTIPESEFYTQDCPSDKVIRSIKPKLINEAGGFRTYDLGENITGMPVFRCVNKKAEFFARVSEEINNDNTINEQWSHGQGCRFIADGKEREYTLLFTWFGFRYIEVSKEAELLRCDVIHSDIPVTSSFYSDNNILNRLYDAYLRTQLCNMHAGIPSDCPHIERRGYTGDGQLTCETSMLVLDSKQFYLKWMEDISDCQDRKSGHVQYTAPYTHCGGGPGGWGCAIVEVPYVFYKTYGDTKPMEKYFLQMLRYFDYLEAHSKDDLVFDDQPGEWHLGEWCVPGSENGKLPDIPEPFVNNYFYIKSLNRVMEIARVIGKKEVIGTLQSIKERKVSALYREYFDEKTGDFNENKNSANAFACDLDMGDERTFANLKKALDEAGVFNTGIFGTDIVIKLLFEKNCSQLAIRLLTAEKFPSFGHMINKNATTIWEDWDTPRSMSHPMFGAAVRYLFYYLLGIRQAQGCVGYTNIIIAPVASSRIKTVSGTVTTSKGIICVRIDRNEGYIEVNIPEGVEAQLIYEDIKRTLEPGETRINF